MDIECVSALSTLEYFDFKSENVTISLINLIKKCITESKGDYSGIYIPNVYSEPLSGLTISCGNFIVEDGKAEFSVLLDKAGFFCHKIKMDFGSCGRRT